MVSRVAGEETGKDRLLGKNQLEGSCALSQFFGARRLLDMRRILGTRRFFGSPRVGNAKAAVQNNFSKTFALPVLSCGEFASDFRDSQGYTAFCTVQLNKKVILDRRLSLFLVAAALFFFRLGAGLGFQTRFRLPDLRQPFLTPL